MFPPEQINRFLPEAVKIRPLECVRYLVETVWLNDEQPGQPPVDTFARVRILGHSMLLKPEQQEKFLKYLVSELKEGEVVTKDALLRHLWGFGKLDHDAWMSSVFIPTFIRTTGVYFPESLLGKCEKQVLERDRRAFESWKASLLEWEDDGGEDDADS